MSIGARNYLQGTADFSIKGGLRTNNIDVRNLTYQDYNDKFKMVHISDKTRYGGIYTPWGQAFPNGQLQVGDDYTFSFDAKGTGTFSKVTNEGENKAGLDGVALTNDWKRYSVTGKITALNKAFTVCFRGGYDVYIKCLKVERGTLATDWSPAPEDTDASIADLTSKYSSLKVDTDGIHTQVGEIVKNVDGVKGRMSSAETSINQTKQAIEQKASKTEVDSLSGRVKTAESTLKQTADGLVITNQKLDSLSVGGRNLLLNTSDEYKSFTNNSWLQAHTYTNFPFVSIEKLTTDDSLTYSVWVNNTSDVSVHAELSFYNASGTRIFIDGGDHIKPQEKGWSRITNKL